MRACRLSYGVLFAFLGEALALKGVGWTGTRGVEMPGTASPLPKLSVKNGRFVTATDDEVLLRGTSLDHNFHAPSIQDEQVHEYRQLGWNLIRLGFHWHLYETAPGVFNETYIETVAGVVSQLGEQGIYSLLDMHQDNWSPLFCGGHGFPAFVGYPADNKTYWVGGDAAYPWPLAKPVYDPTPEVCVPSATNASARFCSISDCANVSATPLGWASTYATAAVGSAAQRLYSNWGGAQDQFVAFWERIAQRFANESAVVGYGIVNEPWLGDVWADPTLLLPGQCDKRNLQPLYGRVARAIRTHDAVTPVWFEPATGGNILDALPAGFDAPPDANSVLGFHIYCPPLQVDIPHPGKVNQTKLWEELALCKLLNGAQLDVRASDSSRLGVPGVLTEFGSVADMNQTQELLRWTVEQAEQRLIPWVYWLLTPSLDPKTDPNWETPILRRPFFPRVPGTIASTAWNSTSGTLTLSFQPSTGRGSMVAFAPTQSFPGGIALVADPAGSVRVQVYNQTTGFAQLTVNATAGEQVHVSLAAR